jgi:hypothetical protein
LIAASSAAAIDVGSYDKVARNVINMVISLVVMGHIMAGSFAVRQSKSDSGAICRRESPIVSAVDSQGRTIWIVDAHGYGKRFIVRADEKLTAFVEPGSGDSRSQRVRLTV